MVKFSIPEELTPKAMPILPTVEELERSGDPEQRFTQWEQESHNVLKENNARFEKALVRIKWCALLHGMQHAFDFRPFNIHTHHYSWCPAFNWYPELKFMEMQPYKK